MSQSKILTFHKRSPGEGVYEMEVPFTGYTWEIKDGTTVIAISPKSYQDEKECKAARDAALKCFQEAGFFSIPSDEK